MNIRRVYFHPRAREAIRSFPEDVRDKLGQSLWDLQKGLRLTMPKSRPMRTVGMGVEELRVRGSDGTYRAFCYSRDERGILVFHAFVKKSQRTLPLDIEIGRKRLREMINEKN